MFFFFLLSSRSEEGTQCNFPRYVTAVVNLMKAKASGSNGARSLSHARSSRQIAPGQFIKASPWLCGSLLVWFFECQGLIFLPWWAPFILSSLRLLKLPWPRFWQRRVFARVNKRSVRASTKANVQCFHLHNWRDAAEQTAASSRVTSTKEQCFSTVFSLGVVTRGHPEAMPS